MGRQFRFAAASCVPVILGEGGSATLAAPTFIGTDSQCVDVSESLSISRQGKGGIHAVWVALLHAIRVVRAPQAAPSARVARGVFVEIAEIAYRGGDRQAEGGGTSRPG